MCSVQSVHAIQRGTVPYKKELMKVYVRRAVTAALDGKDGAH